MRPLPLAVVVSVSLGSLLYVVGFERGSASGLRECRETIYGSPMHFDRRDDRSVLHHIAGVEENAFLDPANGTVSWSTLTIVGGSRSSATVGLGGVSQ